MSNEWYTPSKYIEAARQVMGSIDLDPASCALANQTVRATRYYTQEENGLAQEWYGNVWLNPPFSCVGPWVKRAIREYEKGQIEQAVLLIPNDSTTRWYFLIWDYLISFPEKRILFHRPGRDIEHPRFSTVFVYLGWNEQAFIDVFSKFGRIAKAIDVKAEKPRQLELVS
jgi:ParB family chromosome partitioning protein